MCVSKHKNGEKYMKWIVLTHLNPDLHRSDGENVIPVPQHFTIFKSGLVCQILICIVTSKCSSQIKAVGERHIISHCMYKYKVM